MERVFLFLHYRRGRSILLHSAMAGCRLAAKHMPDPHAIIVYVDGSAIKNPGGSGGIAGVVVYPENFNKEKEIIFRKGFKQTTNNRMELRACIEALKWIRFSGSKFDIQRKIIISDSEYVNTCWRNCLFWRKNGWTSFDGLPVDNYRLIRELISARNSAGSGVELKWQLGKTDEYTKQVDQIAKSMSKYNYLEIDDGFTFAKVSSAKVAGGRATVPCPVGIIEVARIYKKETHYRTGLVKVSFEIYSRLESRYTEKKHAYIHTNNVIELHRQYHYRLVVEGKTRVPTISRFTEVTILT